MRFMKSVRIRIKKFYKSARTHLRRGKVRAARRHPKGLGSGCRRRPCRGRTRARLLDASFGLTDTCNQASKPMTKENTVYCVLQKILVRIISFEFAIGLEIIITFLPPFLVIPRFWTQK